MQRKRFWEDHGFLVFPGFFSEEEIEAASGADRHAWESLSPDVVVDDVVTGRRCRINQLDEEERQHHFKVNDLYLTDPGLRDVALSVRLGMILEELLGDEPAVCNSLSFDKGSQQPDHLDTLYMTPRSERGLVATWMALEDSAPDSGPLRYYPGSNKIRPYRFSDGSMHTHEDEMPRWADYMAGEVERHGLEELHFLAQRGDLFIWNALLLHGGSEIRNPSLTRRSLVTHYWTQTDCEALHWDLHPTPGGWWIKRPPQPVPGEVEISVSPSSSDEEPVDLSSSPGANLASGHELRDRMDALPGVLS
jgi:phytanoyl-CoA hydroxylase